MKLTQCKRHHLEERLQQRGSTWEKAKPCIVSEDGDDIVVDVNHPAYPQAHRGKWPALAKLIACFRKDGDRGVGDTLARNLAIIGAKSMAAAYTKITGINCGCADRQGKLNARFPY